MSEDEDATILIKNADNNYNLKNSTTKSQLIEEYMYIPPIKLKKPIRRFTENLTPFTSENQKVIVSFVAMVTGVCFGYDIGIGKKVAPLVRNEFILDCNEESMIINIWYIGCFMGSIFGGFLIDSFGRRCIMICSLIFLTFGSILSALANHYILFLGARLICGYSGIVSAMSQCIYMAEVSHPRKRSCNLMLHQIGISIGLLLSVSLVININNENTWRIALGITSAPALITCIIAIIFLQRSPSFLKLKKLANFPRIPIEKSWFYIFETFIIMILMLALSQITGRQQVLHYAPRLFAILGICSNIARNTSMMALGVVRVFSYMLCFIMIEKCGRRTALITSATICMTSISLLSLLVAIDDGEKLTYSSDKPCDITLNNIIEEDLVSNIKSTSNTSPSYPLLPTPLAITTSNTEIWSKVITSCEMQNLTSNGLSGGLQILAIITLLVFESAYALGLGPVPFLTLSEVFPAAIRGRCVGFSVAIMWVTHILLYESVEKITRAMTLAGAYLIYGLMCLISIFYIFLFYPETKGKSLNQISQELRKDSLIARVNNNIQNLPSFFQFSWMIHYSNNKNQSTPI